MAKDNMELSADPDEQGDDLRELRRAARDLGKALKVFGKSRLEDVGEDVSDEARALAQEGRRMLREVEGRIASLEKRAEKSVRDHPGAWATGLLGVIGFGLVLGLILRRTE